MKIYERAALGAMLCGSLFLFSGCFSSEDEYQKVMEEKDALARELAQAQDENRILRDVLTNVTDERETLMSHLFPHNPAVALDDGSGQTVAAQASGFSAAQAPAGAEAVPADKVHVVVKGDTLSNIASRYGTTSAILMQLNPFLKSRQGYSVWPDDKIQLP